VFEHIGPKIKDCVAVKCEPLKNQTLAMLYA